MHFSTPQSASLMRSVSALSGGNTTHWLLCRVSSCSPVVTVPSRGAGGEGSMPGGLGSETRNLVTALSASLKDASEDDMRMMRNKELMFARAWLY